MRSTDNQLRASFRAGFRTQTIETIVASDLPGDALLIYASSGTEDRSVLQAWKDRATLVPSHCLAISLQRSDSATFVLPNGSKELPLDELSELQFVVSQYSSAYIDISGLSHPVWAPIVRLLHSTVPNVHVVYAEPLDYRVHSSPSSSSTFDLTDGFNGIGPLPGFSKLRGPDEETLSVFIPFLGFEGVRARQVAATLDPIPRVIPIIGVPGFQIEYPAHSVACNREFLNENRCYGSLRFARASCPFEAMDLLEEVRLTFPEHYLYIAPVGTKPHALGAVLFAVSHPTEAELMYDHPQRKPNRTSGVGPVHIYSIKTT